MGEAGRDCIVRAAHASWWKWDAGSRPFFWRFPEPFIIDMIEGNKTWIKKSLPSYRWKAINLRDPKSKAQLNWKYYFKKLKIRQYYRIILLIISKKT